MIVGALEISFRMPDTGSLKDKRRIVRGLKDRIRRRFNVSVAEIEGQNSWHHCTLAFAAAAASQAAVEREFDRIIGLIETRPEIEACEHWMEFY